MANQAASNQGSERSYPGVIPYLTVSDARAATELYEKAFGATIADQRFTDDNRIMHCEIRINGGPFMINDPFPEHGVTAGEPNCVLHIVTKDIQQWWDRAVAAGFEVTLPLHDAFWGDRYGQLKDRFGLRWGLVGPRDNAADNG